MLVLAFTLVVEITGTEPVAAFEERTRELAGGTKRLILRNR
jgi:hypothetical protein